VAQKKGPIIFHPLPLYILPLTHPSSVHGVRLCSLHCKAAQVREGIFFLLYKITKRSSGISSTLKIFIKECWKNSPTVLGLFTSYVPIQNCHLNWAQIYIFASFYNVFTSWHFHPSFFYAISQNSHKMDGNIATVCITPTVCICVSD